MSKIYLAIPYSFNPKLSFQIANKVAASLMESGHIVFSPISHSHPIGEHIDQSNHTHEFWMEQDLAFVDWADEVHVVLIGEYGHQLVSESKGVREEILHAKKANKPIIFIEHYE